jgi:hypothetical protein
MVDIFKKEMCKYCKNMQFKDNKCSNGSLIEIKANGLKTYKCTNYSKDPSKIILKKPPLSVTAKRDYIKYCER